MALSEKISSFDSLGLDQLPIHLRCVGAPKWHHFEEVLRRRHAEKSRITKFKRVYQPMSSPERDQLMTLINLVRELHHLPWAEVQPVLHAFRTVLIGLNSSWADDR